MNSHKDIECYLKHQKGMGLLYLWMKNWYDLSGWVWNDNSSLELSSLASQRFMLGIPKKNFIKITKKRTPFLGIQADEYSWFGRIKWDKVIWDENIQTLWFVSKFLESPYKKWPDLASFSLGIKVEKDRIGEWNGKYLDWRKVWWDEENKMHVSLSPNGHYKIFMGQLDDYWTIEDRENLKTLESIIMDELDESNIFVEPEFNGTPGQLSKEQQEYLKPFEDKNKKSSIEKDYPNLFGQFLDN